jgi:hypothetical protein
MGDDGSVPDAEPELLAAAEELYAGAPEEFTAARDAAAKRAGLDRDTAKRIKALRKPTTAAALVNRLVHADPDPVDELISLGAALRGAQSALDVTELRRLASERRALVERLTAAAADGAGEAVRRDVATTWDAAVVDPVAAAAVRSGRLIRPLLANGIDAVDVTDSVALPDELPVLAPRPYIRAVAPPKSAPQAAPSQDDRVREDAQARLASAQRGLVRAEAKLASAVAEEQRTADRVGELRAALAAAEASLDAVTRKLAGMHRDRDAAEAERDTSAEALDALRPP